jgi:hypothetical protein
MNRNDASAHYFVNRRSAVTPSDGKVMIRGHSVTHQLILWPEQGFAGATCVAEARAIPVAEAMGKPSRTLNL